MRYQSSASSVKIKIQKMAVNAISPPALDPTVAVALVKLEPDVCVCDKISKGLKAFLEQGHCVVLYGDAH